MSLLARLVNPPGQKGGLGPVIAQGQGADVGGAGLGPVAGAAQEIGRGGVVPVVAVERLGQRRLCLLYTSRCV